MCVRPWELMGTYGNFVRSNFVRAWELMETLCGVTPCVRGNLWELMGAYGNFMHKYSFAVQLLNCKHVAL